jgi:hypothetical protein
VADKKQVDGNQHENPELAIFQFQTNGLATPMMDMMCKTLKTPSRSFFHTIAITFIHRCMEYCVFVIAPTIDIETAPLTPSIVQAFHKRPEC